MSLKERFMVKANTAEASHIHNAVWTNAYKTIIIKH